MGNRSLSWRTREPGRGKADRTARASRRWPGVRMGFWPEKSGEYLGLESSDDFRTNLGIVNPTDLLEEILPVKILDAAGYDVGGGYYRLGPHAHFQRQRHPARSRAEGAGFTAVVRLTRCGNRGRSPGPCEPSSGFRGLWLEGRSAVQRSHVSRGPDRNHPVRAPKHRVVPAAASTDGKRWLGLAYRCHHPRGE